MSRESIERMYHEAGAKFRLKPGGFWRHYVACIGYVHQLLHRHGIERQSHSHFSGIDTALQLAEAANATNEVDTLIAAQVGDAQNVAKDKVGGNCHIKHTDRVGIVVASFTRGKRIPAAAKIEREIMKAVGMVNFSAHIFHDEILFKTGKELFR